VRAALSLDGDLAAVARAALAGGPEGLAAIRLQVGRPVAPMLAATAGGVAEAMERIGGPAVVDAKLDGARVQIHRDGDAVAVFTRTLDDVTARLPEVVAAARALPVRAVVLDAEAIALRPDGRPEPFQVTASRFGRRGGREVPLTTLAFDVLHLDGEDLLALPLRERSAALERAVPDPAARVDRTFARDGAEAQAALDRALAAGHEGVMVKAPGDPYAAGRRAAGWLKVKPVHTFDLVVLAAEWGHGRRRGKLSNLHLGARAADGGFAMVGKTFKGLTDELLAWQTERLLALQERREGIAVHVRPELVVEIAVDGVQRSTRYASGAALRFARVKRYRPDKAPADADTLADVLALRDGGVPG
ncbi:MAG TPA: ATP-dependent DNA ligase, partial [Solirubrobacteraceae bacterium]|jgi:DNA ligase-1